MDGPVNVEVLVKLHVLLQLEALLEGLLANGAHRANLARVGAHVVEEVLALAEDVATQVAAVLDAARVNRDVLPEAVQAGELAPAYPAAVEGSRG